nr:MAG TPA: hypothetical protein [Caudoviricetes sp.]
MGNVLQGSLYQKSSFLHSFELNGCMPRHRISVRCANKTFLIAQTNYLYCLVRLSQLATFTSFHYNGTQK